MLFLDARGDAESGEHILSAVEELVDCPDTANSGFLLLRQAQHAEWRAPVGPLSRAKSRLSCRYRDGRAVLISSWPKEDSGTDSFRGEEVSFDASHRM